VWRYKKVEKGDYYACAPKPNSSCATIRHPAVMLMQAQTGKSKIENSNGADDDDNRQASLAIVLQSGPNWSSVRVRHRVDVKSATVDAVLKTC